jgi:peptidoglycan/LPS O-acetylase OafA/YrhL
MKIIYRPEIDGLRAIAVISVILYHSNINIFHHQLVGGGFLGVDIFFVISGYLITSIILKEINVTKKFSLKNFYERRIRRVVPMLLFIMILSYFFCWVLILPKDFIDFSKSSLSLLFLNSNLYFYFTGNEYGATSELYKPLLHTWSLSIEEQFYILFPILFLILYKYLKRNILIIFIILFLFSLILANKISGFNPKLSFYFFFSRAYELLLGSIGSLYCNSNFKINKNLLKIFRLILPTTGIILIFYSLLYLSREAILKNTFITLIPISGTLFIILFYERARERAISS